MPRPITHLMHNPDSRVGKRALWHIFENDTAVCNAVGYVPYHTQIQRLDSQRQWLVCSECIDLKLERLELARTTVLEGR